MANNGEPITETHDFMNVQSFSQLPFIRPAAVKEKNPPIRLFGIEFNGQDQPELSKADQNNDSNNNMNKVNGEDCKDSEGNHDNTRRRFECQYCFRNFPTSQALGGHQNAHKRERQNAKRAYLQSTDVVVPHAYGFLNHHRRGGGGGGVQAATYSSWNAGTTRFYSNHGAFSSQNVASSSATITGSPLGLWRVPTTATPGIYATPGSFGPGTPSNSRWPILGGDQNAVESSQSRYWTYDVKSNVQDHVSLDLHL